MNNGISANAGTFYKETNGANIRSYGCVEVTLNLNCNGYAMTIGGFDSLKRS